MAAHTAGLLLIVWLCLFPAEGFAAEASGGGALSWLASPIDPARAHTVDSATSWHGRLMVLIWGGLFPAGILAARFFKILPGQDWPRDLDDKRWWRTHLATQYTGGALLLVAFALSLQSVGSAESSVTDWHHVLGWGVAVLAAWQFLGGWLRGSKGGPTAPAPNGSLEGDHYDMTRRRRIFEYAHKVGGYLALLIACLAIVTGLYAANGPRWMWLGLFAWWVLLVLVTLWLQRRGFARDTYEAIWGPGPEHPGNRLRPIGIGIRRVGRRPESDKTD